MGLHLLIVEDDGDLRAAIQFGFEQLGCLVSTASNGESALEILGHRNFDIILSDINMPVKNGVELLKEIRKKDSEIKIVMMSGGSVYTSEELILLGADAVVSKPLPTFQSILKVAE